MEGPEEGLQFTDIPVIQRDIPDTSSAGGYEVSILANLSPEYLVGEPGNPGPLVRLAYPEVLRLRLVSRKFRDLIDTDYFWELKTRRDFGVEDRYPQEESWKAEYLRRAQTLAPEFLEAAEEGDEVQVQQLLDLGVNPNVRGGAGWTALMMASWKGHLRVVESLLAAGAKVNAQNEDEMTALMVASETEVVELLLAEGAKVNAEDASGRTALMWASSQGHLEVVELLLNKGAELDARDRRGWTARQRASSQGRREVAKLLRAAGAS